MTPAIYTIMMRFNFRRTHVDPVSPPNLTPVEHNNRDSTPLEPISRRVFDGIRNVMQLKQSGMCGSCK